MRTSSSRIVVVIVYKYANKMILIWTSFKPVAILLYDLSVLSRCCCTLKIPQKTDYQKRNTR